MGYPDRGRSRVDRSKRATGERLEALIGERRHDTPEEKAVTREESASLGTIALTSAAVTAAPTAAQHNAVVEDIRALASVLNAMGAKFTWS